MRPMITIDARMINHSGIGVYLKNILKGIINYNGFNVAFFGDHDLLSQHFDVSLQVSKFDESIFSLQEQVRYLKLPKQPIFWSPHFNVPLFKTIATKQIVTIHDIYHVSFASSISKPKKLIAKAYLKKALQSDVVITISHFSKNEILNHFKVNPQKIHVIHNGVDVKKFQKPLAHVKTQQKIKALGINKPYIIAVGNVKPHKNYSRLIAAFKSHKEMSSEHQLVIIGKHDGFISGDKSIKGQKKENIIITGFVDDEILIALYQSAQALIFPSLYEGFGLPPLEAMASGTIAVVSDIPVVREVCGEAGIYFNPYDIDDIREKMWKVLTMNDSEKNIIINNGLNHVKRFSWEQSVLKHVELFRLI